MIVSVLHLLVPGLAVAFLYRGTNPLGLAARIILWSVSSLILGSFVFAAIGLPVRLVFWLGVAASLAVLVKNSKKIKLHRLHWPAILIAAGFVILLAIFSFPFLTFHQGLPTGDSQKAIIWANQILSETGLPNYQLAIDGLNRDPVDFYTPGLHSLTASIMSVSSLPLTEVGFFAIAISIAVALLATATARFLFPTMNRWLLSTLPAIFLLTQFRFLRYIREPGYHFQNIVGELMLFGVLFVAISLLDHWRKTDVVLAVFLLASLALSHQFSAFVAAFALLPALISYLIKGKQRWLAGAVIAVGLIGGFALGLHRKIADIFTGDSHLAHLAPDLLDYPRTMGPVWFVLGLAGLAWLCIQMRRQHFRTWSRVAFAGAVLAIMLLSQGPRLGISIPPVRALFYLAFPFSILAAFFASWLFEKFKARPAVLILLGVLVLFSVYSTTAQAWNLSHAVRTNSTLTPSQLELVQFLETQDGGVLIDDYNRRSSSWLVLSGRPMFTRIAADLSRQMDEAKQSELRNQIYLKQLAFEKIFALGSYPQSVELMKKHNVNFVTGITKSSQTAFANNPALSVVAEVGDISLFAPTRETKQFCERVQIPAERKNWLLRNSTLVNDIGDREDTFEHLSASIRAARLAAPETDGACTWRSTTSPVIPLSFNVGDFVKVLWDQDGDSMPDNNLELYVVYADGTQEVISLPATENKIDERGFVTINLQNPNQAAVAIDFIALGLSQTH